MLISKPYSTSSPFSKGFTLVEMMVVVAIFLIMTAIILSSLPSFRDKTSLDLVIKEILTEIRQLQVYGGAARINNAIVFSPTSTLIPFGFYFYTSTPQQIILFFDNTTNNGRYDPGESVETYFLSGAVQLFKVCLSNTSPINAATCSNNMTSSITFTNPYPQPIIKDSSGTTYFYALLQFKQTRSNETRSIFVSQAGRIVVTTP